MANWQSRETYGYSVHNAHRFRQFECIATSSKLCEHFVAQMRLQIKTAWIKCNSDVQTKQTENNIMARNGLQDRWIIPLFYLVYMCPFCKWLNKLVYRLIYCSSPRKSLVKGERFIRGLKRNQSCHLLIWSFLCTKMLRRISTFGSVIASC